MTKLNKHSWGARFSLEHFLLHVAQNFGSKLSYFLQKLRSELTILKFSHVLQFALIINRSNQGEAISIFEKVDKLFSNTIFSNGEIRVALLELKSIVKIVNRSNWLVILINHLQSKIPHQPHETGKRIKNVFSVLLVPL